MADEEYCSPEDVYRLGVPRGSLDEPVRAVSSVDTLANTIAVAGHGYELDDGIGFHAFPGGELAGGLAHATVFYARPVVGSSSLFQVAASPGGAALDLTSSGTAFGVASDTNSFIRLHIRAWSQVVHRYIPAHAMPLTRDVSGRYPMTVRQIVAVLSGESASDARGRSNARVSELAGRTRESMKLLLSGLPTRDTGITTEETNLARGASPTLCPRTDGL